MSRIAESESKSESTILAGVGVDNMLLTLPQGGMCWQEGGVCISQVDFCLVPAPMSISFNANQF